MTKLVSEAVVGVFVCWAIAAYAIWKWGPGLRKRTVRCPEKKLWAKVVADQREAEFGSLKVVDVRTCSLDAGTTLNCSKRCMAQL
jgi:hypothetical protein